MPTSRSLLLAAILLPVFLLVACGSGEFSGETWRAARKAGKRGGGMIDMAKDLVAKGTLNGMTREEVLALLGEDDGASERAGHSDLEWLLDQGIMSCTVLRVLFAPDGKVQKAWTQWFSF